MMKITLTANQVALLTHIQALNAKTSAWVAESPTTRWASGLSDDLDHWAEYGIDTPAALDHYLLAMDVYELTRSLFGYKPSWSGLNAASDADLQKELDSLHAYAKAERERETAEKAEEAARIAELTTHKSGWTIGELILV